MKGKLFGIGVGPGDPELMTIKAINAIVRCDVIAIPETGNGERTAFAIIGKHLEGKDLLICRFVMEHDIEKREAARQKAADDIAQHLERGKDVGYVTLGDPTTFSTYMYVHKLIIAKGFETKIIPAVTSFCAAAAELGVALCEGHETLTVFSGHSADVVSLLDQPGNKVIMKSGTALARILDLIKAQGQGSRTKIICNATMENQRVFHSLDEFEKSPETGYFTVAIIK